MTTALPLQELCNTAIKAAEEAGRHIRTADRTQLERQFKPAGSSRASQLVTEVDLESEAIIRSGLQTVSEQWGIEFVGEETANHTAIGHAVSRVGNYYWCVDPLDGTLPFFEGRSGYAVSIALVDPHGIPIIGVVFDPSDSSLLCAIRGQGMTRGTPRHRPAKSTINPHSSLMVFVDDSFRAEPRRSSAIDALGAVANDLQLDGVQLVYGSGAVKNACQVLDYPNACYIKLPKVEIGGGSIWDFAATACIVTEAGGWVSDAGGNPLDLNQPETTFMNQRGVLYASNASIATRLVAGLEGSVN